MPAETKTKSTDDIPVPTLVSELKTSISGEVRFSDGDCALYATDASNYRQEPIGVVLPKNENDITETVRLCNKYEIPLLPRGGGTSLAGQCCNEAVVMDMTKYYNKILDLDENNRLVSVQAGTVLDKMRGYTKEQADLTYGPDPATHSHCAIGGMLGNNSCGIHSLMSVNEGYGPRTSDNTESLTVLTYDGLKMEVGPTSEEKLEQIIQEGGRKGEIYENLRDLRDKYADEIREEFPDIPRRVSGYNLDELLPENGFNVARALVGSEGTCVTILEATMKLLEEPPARSLLVLGYEDIYSAGQHVTQIKEHQPTGFEGIDEKLISYMRETGLNVDDLSLLPEGSRWLLVEFGGQDKDEADEKANKLKEELEDNDNPPNIKLFDDKHQEELIWGIRESGLGATAFVPNIPDTWTGWEDAAVNPDDVGDYLQEFRSLLDKYNYDAALYGHYGQGCIHCRITFDLETKKGVNHFEQFTNDAADLVVKYGGSLTGEHGDGQARADLLQKMYSEDLLHAFREFKTIWDPEGKMNPGKIVEPYSRVENLRLGSDYEPAEPETHFKFPDDNGSFSRAALRCVGVGNCRRHEGGTMCPSYMVTREEKDSTRGRSRMLFEMLQGDIVKEGWNDESVKEALDLCLACKGCKGDCPVNVDMATYKAEFLSHYYEENMRPRSAYAFGLIYWWSRFASWMPGVANFITHATGLSSIAKAIGGIAPQRDMPEFTKQTFKKWFSQNHNGSAENTRDEVILWPDTFSNFFKPKTLIAAANVLEEAGYKVKIPGQTLCCGRPLYDPGFLDKAKDLLQQILDALRDDIHAGTPVVGVEPSCVAVFRDELCNLMPNDEDAKRLKKQTFTLAEFLLNETESYEIPKLNRKALLHGHCHHDAIMKLDAEQQLLEKMQLDFDTLDSGCCGMAGYFGYEKGEHYEVSIKAGERVLLPAVRDADEETLIIADGFSCREQIEQLTDRKGLHLAEVLQMALNKSAEHKEQEAGE